MKDDTELLCHYVATGSEADFTELVRRRLGFVHAQALRRVANDSTLAEEVAQRVFTDLARKARTVAARPSLTGWLYVSTMVAAAEAVRKERRRKHRETEAYRLETILAPGSGENEAEWHRLRPILDELMLELGDQDREAVVQRFFEQRPYAEIGRTLAVTEDSARKRVERAIEKLREKLASRGVTSAATAVGLALGEHAAAAAPALAARVAGAALGAAAGGGTGMALLATLKAWTLPGLAAVALFSAWFDFRAHERARQDWQREIDRLSGQEAEIAKLDEENQRLARSLQEVATLRQTLAAMPAPPALVVADVAKPTPVPARMVITGAGAILWEGQQLNSREFLARLRTYHAQSPDPAAGIEINTEPGSVFGQTFYITDEARKAEIKNLYVETPSLPEPATGWFRKIQTPSNRPPAAKR
jgi:RNA polymerase sigma factor (sigma-70 family)